MTIKIRLSKLEKYCPKIIYPPFTATAITQTKETYNQWLLDNNVGLTQSMINGRNIKVLADMYE